MLRSGLRTRECEIMEEKDYINFKNLLEYYISHLEWVVNKDIAHIGYLQYIEPLIQTKNFKKTGQGYNGDNIQKQITSWDNYEGNQVCINISFNQKSGYQTKICYLNWIGTGINIIAEWSNNHVIGLYQELFIEKPKPTPSVWQSLGMSKSVASLSLFDNSNTTNSTLKAFYKNFTNALVKHELKQKTKKQMIQIEKQIDLLKYKKQIILQGPPGTGKTREAKIIAKTIILNDVRVETISDYIKIGDSFPNASGTMDYYKIKAIDEIKKEVILASDKSKKDGNFAKFDKIIERLKDLKEGVTLVNVNGQHPYEIALAKFIHSNILKSNNQFKLIQFHPSYTYEDFVRGIVAESKGVNIEYLNVNKTLGLFAKTALSNFKASRRNSRQANLEAWIDDKFELFKNDIEAKLPEKEITLSGDITIFDVKDTHFKYAEKWKTPGYLKFAEFKNLIKAVIQDELELSNKQLDKEKFLHAHYRYTYYNALLKLFFNENNFEKESLKVEPKNYVIIIDEINRANLSSVLGELIYALEYRGEEVESMYKVEGSQKLILPPNLYIVGTMNTADRSVGHIDYAIRRRFAFVDIVPKKLVDDKIIFHNDWFKTVSDLFIENYNEYTLNENTPLKRAKTLSAEFRPEDVWIGHSYFIQKKLEGDIVEPVDFRIRVDYEIKPILLEYVKDGVLTGKVGSLNVEDYIKSL